MAECSASHRHYTETEALRADCPVCVGEQRSQMQSVDNRYLQRKASECIQDRNASRPLTRIISHGVANAVCSQQNTCPEFAVSDQLLTRKSELASRVSAWQNYQTRRTMPLRPAGAIPLQPLVPTPPPSPSAAQGDVPEIFFDDALFSDEQFVLLNGEVYPVLRGMQRGRIMYGIDTATAALRSAVKGAASESQSNDAALLHDENHPDNSHVQAPSPPVSKPYKSRPAPKRSAAVDVSRDRVASAQPSREYMSSSGRRYQVIELDGHLPPISRGGFEGVASFHASKEDLRSQKGNKRSASRGVPSRSHSTQNGAPADRDSAHHRVESNDRRAKAPKKPSKPREGSGKGSNDKHGCCTAELPLISAKQRPHRHAERSEPKRHDTSKRRNLDLESSDELASPSLAASEIFLPCSPQGSGHGQDSSTTSHHAETRSHEERAHQRETQKPSRRSCEERLPPAHRGRNHRGSSANRRDVTEQHKGLEHEKKYREARAGSGEKARRRRDLDRLSDSDDSHPSPSSNSLVGDRSSTPPNGWAQNGSASSTGDKEETPQDLYSNAREQRTKNAKHLHKRADDSSKCGNVKNEHVAAQRRRISPDLSRKGSSDNQNASLRDAASSLSSLFASSASNSSSSVSSQGSSSSTDEHRDGRPRRCGESSKQRNSLSSSSLSAEHSDDEKMKDPSAKYRKKRNGNKRASTAAKSSYSTASPPPISSCPDADSSRASRQSHEKYRDGKAASRQSCRPPNDRCIPPGQRDETLPDLSEAAMLPSARYEGECVSPVEHVLPPAASAQSAAMSGKEGAVAHPSPPAAAVAGAAAASQVSASSSLAARFTHGTASPEAPPVSQQYEHLSLPSVGSPDPLCTTPQQREEQPRVSAASLTQPVDLGHITEYVLRVIRARLGQRSDNEDHMSLLNGQYLSRDQPNDAFGVAAADVERQRLEEAKQDAAEREAEEETQRRQEAEQRQQLRQLLHNVRNERDRCREESVPLDTLSDSLKFALAQVGRLDTNDFALSIDGDVALRGTAGATKRSGAAINVNAAGETSGQYSSDEPVLNLSDLEVGVPTLDRLFQELCDRRMAHAAEMRERKAAEAAQAAEEERARKAAEEQVKAERQRKAATEKEEERKRKIAEEEDAAARAKEAKKEKQRALAEQQNWRSAASLMAEEAAARGNLLEDEKASRSTLVDHAAASEDEAREREHEVLEAYFEEKREDLQEAELDARAAVAAMEQEEAEDYWDVAAQLWQAALDEAKEAERLWLEQEREVAEVAEAEEAERRRVEAWQAERAEEEERLFEAAQQAEEKRRRQASQLKSGKIVKSNLIPNQMLDVSEADGKIRLVGDPHIEAVEARARERRRADRARLERLVSVLPLSANLERTGGTSATGQSLSSRQPSTVRMGTTGHEVAASAGKSSRVISHASSRRSTPSTGYRFPAQPDPVRVRANHSSAAAGGETPRGRSRLQSRTDLVTDGDVDLGVEGRRVGTVNKSRSRASSLASVGVMHLGAIFNAATPHKSRGGDGAETEDSLASDGAGRIEY